MTERREFSGIPEVDYFEARPEGLHIYSWSPSPPGAPDAKSTQVHLHIPTGVATFVVRFKGPGTLDRLIAALQAHRADVFGPPEET